MSIKEVYDWYAKEGYLLASVKGNLTLYKYSTRTVLEHNWNYHTTTARGLVLDDTGRVIARPWPKFFNVNERPETNITFLPKDEVPELAEKLDGSAVVVFCNPYTREWEACTLGSWESDQAKYANEWLKTKCKDAWDPTLTHMFELIGPKNRIVVDYPETKMILTGLINTESTEDYSYREVWHYGEARGLETVNFQIRSATEIDLDDKTIVNKEGYVARFSNGFRVKLKYTQYMILHRLLTGLSTKNIWEALSAGRGVEMAELVPDEFFDWFQRERYELEEAHDYYAAKCRSIFETRPKTTDRKELAKYFLGYKEESGILFMMLDGKPYDAMVWKKVKPESRKTFQKS